MYKCHLKHFKYLKFLQRQDVPKIPTSTPIYPLKMVKIRNSYLGYPDQSKLRPYLVSIFNENYNFLICYLGGFLLQMGSGSKLKRSQLRLASLFKKPLIKNQLLMKQFRSKFISSSRCCTFSAVVCFF